MCVHDQARLYYRLLHCGIEKTRKILLGRRSDPSLGVLIGRPTAPVSQWAPYFNTLEPLRQDGAVEAEPASSENPQHVTCDLSDLPESLSSHMEPGQSGEGGVLCCELLFGSPLMAVCPQAAQPSSSLPVREAASAWPHHRPSPPRSLSARGCSCSVSPLLKVSLESGILPCECLLVSLLCCWSCWC